MLTIIREQSIDRLARQLLDRRRPGRSVLEPELFVVQNHGMARWLSLNIAEAEGIAANLRFKFPAELFWDLIRTMDEDIPEALPSDRHPMHWALFDLLKSHSHPALSPLQDYILHEDPVRREMRRWQLAGRIADVFDQYQTYRPDLILNWEDREYEARGRSEYWQSVLWKKLQKRWEPQETKHRAELQQQLVRALENRELPSAAFPSRVSVFGVSEMPPIFLEAFVKMACCTEVHMYLADPVLQGENELVASLGRAGAEFTELLESFREESGVECRVESSGAGPDREEDQGGRHLLGHLRRDLLGSREEREEVQADDSVQVHSCHSPRREVEVLYDQLLKLLDDHNSLQPSDILVLCPQMDRYAPEIDAVFGAVEPDMPEIPYHLSDGGGTVDEADLAFRGLLNLVDSRFKVTQVLDILDLQPIREAFSFSEDHINTIEQWIDENRIRWGIDGAHKAALDLPGTDRYTWQAGLHRMFAGYALQEDGDRLFEGLYPYEEIRQSDHVQLLGRFSHFMHRLYRCREQAGRSCRPREWAHIFHGWLKAFFPDTEPYARQVQWLRESIADMAETAGKARFDRETAFIVVRDYLLEILDQKRTGGGRPGRGVAFSAMVQMRNIPADVVCMIGMDDGAFPRSGSAVGFDLISQSPRRGDRSPGRDDRQLFLESLMGARRHLYFSYVGQNNQKDVKFPPSVILRELIDYLDDVFEITPDELFQHHRLHSFSPFYFNKYEEVGLLSYSAHNRKVAERLNGGGTPGAPFLKTGLPEPDEARRSLTISDLISFFQHPTRYLLRERLGIYLREDHILDEDREDFELDGLQRYQLGQAMLERFLNDTPPEAYRSIASAKDLLPEGWPGRQAVDRQLTAVRRFGQALQAVIDQPRRDSLEADLRIGPFHLTGHLDDLYEQGQLLYRYGEARPKDLVELWIKHLFYQVVRPTGYAGGSRLYSRDDKQDIVSHHLPPFEDALDLVENLLGLYWRGLQENILFFPKTSFAFAEAHFTRGKDAEAALKSAGKEWVDRYTAYGKEGDDAYNRQCMGKVNPLEHKELSDIFQETSSIFWQPFFGVLNKDEEGSA